MRVAQGRQIRLFHLLLVAFVAFSAPRAEADVQYVYDAAGRLIQVIATDGSSAVYSYDVAGNILSIQRLTSSQLFLAAFAPLSGVPGSQVTLSGSGFSATPAANAVTFNGTSATVVSSTTNQIVVTVPASATTGPIAVTVGSNTATSSSAFVIETPPSLSSVTPAVVNAGATVTVTGANLEPLPGATQVSVGPASVQKLSLSATQLTLRAPTVSGHVVVTTPYGSATSTTQLIVAPGSIGAANIVSSGMLTGGGAAQSLNINQQSKHGVFAFEGTQGQLLSIQVSSLITTPGNGTLSYQVFSPAKTVIASGSISATSQSIHLPSLSSTGTYLVTFGTAAFTAQLAAALEINHILDGTGGTVSAVATTSGGQSKRMWITAMAGQDVGVALAGLTMSAGNTVNVALYQPNGTYVWGRPCNRSDPASSCGLQYIDLPVSGKYYLMATPGGTATMSFNLHVSAPVTGTLVPGTPTSLDLATPGQFAYLDFTVTQGQTIALNLGSVVTNPGGVNMYFVVNGPTGSTVAGPSTTTATTFNLTDLAAGTYKVFLVPYFGITATAQLTLANGLTGTLQSNGTTSATLSNSVPGQNGYFTIPATAGQSIGIALRHLVTNPGSVGSINLSLFQPNGTYMWGRPCNVSDPVSSCGLQFTDLPVSGNYRLVATPGNARMSFDLTVSQALTGTLTPGTPSNLNFAAPGQFAWLSFTAAQGDTMALNLGSVVTTPGGVNMYFVVNGPTGAAVAGPATTTATTFNLTNLAAGTYKVFLVPYFGITATAQLSLGSWSRPTLPVNGSASSFATSVPGQHAYFTFAGTAGEGIGIGLKNLVTSSGNVTFSVTRSDGAGVTSSGVCSTANPGGGCNVWWGSLPQTGNYGITVVPNANVTMSFDLSLSSPGGGSLALGVPENLSMSAWGQWSLRTFTLASAQSVSVTLDSVSTSPSNQNVSVLIYNSNWNELAQSAATGTRTYNLNNLAAGTYRIAVVPWYGATSSARLSVN